MVIEIKHAGEILAIIVQKGFAKPGIHFFTPGNFSQQLGYLNHPAGKIIQPHVHNHVVREVKQTLEVLFIKSDSFGFAKGKTRGHSDFIEWQQEGYLFLI